MIEEEIDLQVFPRVTTNRVVSMYSLRADDPFNEEDGFPFLREAAADLQTFDS